MFYIFNNVFNTIVIICMWLLCTPNLGLLLQSLGTIIYAFIVTILNCRILETFDDIIEIFHQKYRRENDQTSTNRIRKMYLKNCIIYREYFEIEIFNFWKLNFSFIVNTSLFMFSYVVVFSQTSFQTNC